MPRRFIQQFGPTDKIDQTFLAAQKQLRPNKNGNLYLQVDLSDRTGSIAGRMWNAGDHEYRSLKTATTFASKGTRSSSRASCN